MAYPPDPLAENLTDSSPAVPNAHAGYHNDEAAAINDIVTELGATPKGAEADLSARLAAIEADVAALSGGGSGIQPMGGYVAGSYYGTPIAVAGAHASFLNQLYCVPYYVREAKTFDRIGVECTTAGVAGSLIRLGMWNHNSSTGRPGTLVLDAGTVSVQTTGVKEVTISQALSAGWVWLGMAFQGTNASPSFRGGSGATTDESRAPGTGFDLLVGNMLTYTSVSGAFGTLVGSTPTPYGTARPAIVLRST